MRGKNETPIYDQLPAIAEQILKDYCPFDYTQHDVDCLTRTLQEVCDVAVSESQIKRGESIDLIWALDRMTNHISD